MCWIFDAKCAKTFLILKLNQLIKAIKVRPRLLASLLAAAGAVVFFFYFNRFVRYQEPAFLTFHELERLSQNPHPNFLLKQKLERFWRTPIISNEAYYAGVQPYRPRDPKLGPLLHLVSWNIEKSIQMKDAVTAFSSAEGSSRYQTVLRQRGRLEKADVIVLQDLKKFISTTGP